MAAGSEQISTKWLEGAERVCVKCGAEIKNMERDVGEVRTRFGPVSLGRLPIGSTRQLTPKEALAIRALTR